MLTFKPTAIIYFFVIWVFLAGCAPEEEEETSQTASYSVGGSVSGLSNGTVVIQNNGSDDLVVFQPGSSSSTISFSFPTKISSGNAFNVTVLVQPLSQIHHPLKSSHSPSHSPYFNQSLKDHRIFVLNSS